MELPRNELRRNRVRTGVAGATIALLLVAGCGQVDDRVRPAVKSETTVRTSAPNTIAVDSASSESEASRARQNEMKRRIAEVKDSASEGR
jgi:hypothetical protein